ncbi:MULTISPECIES: invasion associated locus b family protein [unclassified Methylobacterium]|uniref:invasion associated locus b family protein n=1 Tax=unclassified Methylobacterium TaxID=2615210 RepID=UPI001FBC0CD2|nr:MULTISPECIES: invasion associated locus b family protein [unclassified Methylobacterium]MCJ2019309.1 invasion associated locus b family protein [Methylobacterium sp. E-065]
MVRAPRLLPLGALVLLSSGLVTGVFGGLLGAPGLSATVAWAQDAAVDTSGDDAAPAQRGRRRGRQRPAARAERRAVTPPGMQQATPVAIFGDWNVFVNGDGRTKLCYAIAQPQARSPRTLKRDTAYLFVSVRKGENVQNEVAVMLGFPSKPAASQVKPGSAATPTDPSLNLGSSRYGLVVKDGNAWLQNPAEEARVVSEMSTRNPKLIIKTTSMRGNPTSDEYALGGFAEAMKRTREECGR